MYVFKKDTTQIKKYSKKKRLCSNDAIELTG